MKIQIAKIVFLANLTIMKKVLDLGEFKLGKKTEDFKYYKKEIMDYFYKGLKKLFKQLFDSKIIKKCSCKANLRKGYSNCESCGGSGFCNNDKNSQNDKES